MGDLRFESGVWTPIERTTGNHRFQSSRAPKGRFIPAFVVTALLSLGCMAACSETTRYDVLSYFFDGVPKPGEVSTPGYRPSGRAAVADASVDAGGEAIVLRAFPAHPPYRKNECDRCHSRRTGNLTRTLRDGLCVGCHPAPPADARYVHGPVAVNDCLICHHHHHSARFSKMLLDAPAAICRRCHDPEELTTEHPPIELETKGCTDCHNPHGGNDRFFLRRK